MIGAYHPLTKSVNLVAEYTHAEAKFHNSDYSDTTTKTVTLGAIMFF